MVAAKNSQFLVLRSHRTGMTLIELLLAMTILAIVLTGVTALAFALSSARDKTSDFARKQAQFRFAMQQLGDVIRYSRLVCYWSDTEAAFWTCDTNADGKMNINEMAVIQVLEDGTQIVLSGFSSATNPEVPMSLVMDHSTGWWAGYGTASNDAVIIPQCSNARIYADAVMPNTRYVSILFNMTADGQTTSYTISGTLRGWTGGLLSSAGEVVSDDD